jgi:hypothetical protein
MHGAAMNIPTQAYAGLLPCRAAAMGPMWYVTWRGGRGLLPLGYGFSSVFFYTVSTYFAHYSLAHLSLYSRDVALLCTPENGTLSGGCSENISRDPSNAFPRAGISNCDDTSLVNLLFHDNFY